MRLGLIDEFRLDLQPRRRGRVYPAVLLWKWLRCELVHEAELP